MPVYKAPVDDTLFVLNDVLGLEKYNNLPGFADAAPDMIEAIAGEAAKLSEEVLFPLNRVGDLEGCTRNDDGSVTPPAGFKQGYDAYCQGGWSGLSVPEEFGG
ncbi:MAG: acyl-CoA dehydrogenase N-terminal domain-containing protein, partial [Rhizobiaceae bacterium]|nr:acyl-CoA dehydrogenase N-terminal domain-containing protein [Rhizobiaceae bacterium]